jgi:hypothetical protein
MSRTLLVAIVVATMAAAVSPSEAGGCKRTCTWKCNGVGVFNRCIGGWYKVCGEWKCHMQQGSADAPFSPRG